MRKLKKKMKIALYDDHPIILDGLRSYLSKKEDVEIVGTATKKVDIISILKSQEVDILVSDVMTEEEIGLELFEEVQSMGLETKVIVYSSLQGELVFNFLYEYGVVGIVNKNKGLDELWELIELAHLNTEYKRQSSDTPPPMLTPKEKEIVRYLARGLAAKEIAALTEG